MNIQQLSRVNAYYYQMFNDMLDQQTLDILSEIESASELEDYEQDISAGTYDCAEAVLEEDGLL